MMRKRTKYGRYALNVFAGLGLVYLFAPIFFIVAFSFNKPKGNFNIAWQSFTFDNWLHPFAEQSLTRALWKSLEIAAVSTFVSTILGSLIAVALSRYKFRGSGGINLFLVLPLTTPEIADAQKADSKLKHCFRRNAVLDKRLEVRLVDDIFVVCQDGRMIIPKPLQRRAVLWYHHYLQHPGHTWLEETIKARMY